MSRNTRPHPTEQQLLEMSTKDLTRYADEEAELLREQKQTAVPRLLEALAYRLEKAEHQSNVAKRAYKALGQVFA